MSIWQVALHFTGERDLFEAVGFKVTERKIDEMVNNLTSPRILKFSDDKVKQHLGGRVAFVLTAE